MSFDILAEEVEYQGVVSIPLEQGNVFRLTATEDAVKGIVVSIPLEQGNVFRLYLPLFHQLNQQVSIPLEQGNVFRHSC